MLIARARVVAHVEVTLLPWRRAGADAHAAAQVLLSLESLDAYADEYERSAAADADEKPMLMKMPAAPSLPPMMIKAAAADYARSAVVVAVALADGKLLLLNMPAAPSLPLTLMLIRSCC